jgi:hypothetical protein
MASTFLSRTLGTPTSSKIWTFSTWIKRSGISSGQHIFSIDNGSARDAFSFDSDDGLRLYFNSSTSPYADLSTNRLLRDTSAFYNLVLTVDTTQATADDRVKLYINGTQYTWDETTIDPSQNYDTFNASGNTFRIGRDRTAAAYLDGILAHTHFIDGTAYPASTFGETDSTSGIWKPKTAPSVTYGNNGFFLKFENSGAMGTDSSGNSNTFTVSGTLTQNVDTPSNNFNTLNGIGVRASNFTLSNGNSSATCGADWETLEGTLGVNKGKWYYEAKWNGSNYFMAGWTSTNFMSKVPTSYVGHTITEPSYALGLNDAKVYYSTSSSATQDSAVWGNTLTSSDILGCAIDIDNGKLYWSKNGVWMNSGDPTSGATGTGAYSITDTATNYFWQPVMGCYNSAGNFNFGQGYFGTTAVASAGTAPSEGGIFEYDCPSGYQALCTKGINSF